MFYRFKQNNSGGYYEYDLDTGITECVYIEADSEEEALKKAESIGIYFDGVDKGLDCECCGDRWSQYPEEIESFEEVKERVLEGWREYETIIFKNNKYEIFRREDNA